MKSQFAEDVLEQHRELWAAARRADEQGSRYLEALEAGDAVAAGRSQVTYREQLMQIVAAIRALDDLMEHGTAAAAAVNAARAEFAGVGAST
jgi:hypothetical protein